MRGFNLLLFWGCCVMHSWERDTGPTLKPMTKDNNCRDSTMCPSHATCTSTEDSYYCACKQGFRSSNGQNHFKGPGVECKDVDECSESQPCGPNSVCKNLSGRYECSCLHGFSSPTGNNWKPGKPGNFSCTDIDECTEMCPINSTCTNTPGSYFCTCHPGFAPSNGQLNFTDQKVECRDIDECRQDPSTCGPNSICTNALGSYSCGCIAGFHPNPEGSQKDGNFSCQRVPFKCKEDVIPDNEQVQQCQERTTVKPEYVSFCAQINNIFSVLDNVCENKTTVVSLKNTTESFVPVLKRISTWTKFTKEETSSLATVFLESVESMTLAAFLKPSANVTQTVRTDYVDIESKVINKECSEENVNLNLAAKGDKMKIRCSTIEESESTGTTGVAFVSFVGMESVLNERFFQDHQAPLTISKIKLKMNSRVVGGIMTGEKKDGFSDPVIYTLENIQVCEEVSTEIPVCLLGTPRLSISLTLLFDGKLLRSVSFHNF
ncbi:adhesion G protein-coupled receptor E1-like isoform X2 [Rhinopithecus roxellana]|uniref:adhesion G protein-coupled receptor E1-like isoform X2 n=1 Tax=Rhinopithecus roxellana TaxID=61622 RepID=UPI001237201A|nr:adhesion G protein-coupled receptor E1-like isoform X2 [Rhinopithecus roxellana]